MNDSRMTDSHRVKLLVACTYARLFLKHADAEVRGAPAEARLEFQEELAAAIRDLDSEVTR